MRKFFSFIIMLMLAFSAHAKHHDEARQFAEQLIKSQALPTDQQDFNHRLQQLPSPVIAQEAQGNLKNMQTLYDNHYDTADKIDLIQQDLKSLGSPPALAEASNLLKQKHRYVINENEMNSGELGQSQCHVPKELLENAADNTADEGYHAAEFGNTLTQVGALKSIRAPMQDNLGGIYGDANNPSVFHGLCRRCRVTLGSGFKDCCHLDGIAKGLLGGCREEEKLLANATVKDNRCHQIEGKYCVKKKFGICLEKKEAYCCYGSQVAKIIQEIAHQQQNISWGNGESPLCNGLTAAQLSRLNFDDPFAQSQLAIISHEYQATVQEKYKQVQAKINPSADMRTKVENLQKNAKQGRQR